MNRATYSSAILVAVATVIGFAACGDGTTPPPGGQPTAGAGNTSAGTSAGGSAGAAGSSAASGAGTAGGTAGAGGTNAAGAGGSGGTAGGGTGAPACKPVTAVNGSGLTVDATDISAFKYADAKGFTKMAYDPVGKVVVLLKQDGGMSSFDPNLPLPTTAATAPITTVAAYNSGYEPNGAYNDHRGIAFDKDGNLYVLAAQSGANVGVNIKKGTPGAAGAPRTWTTLVTTSQGFQAGGTDYDHTFSSIAISADGQTLYLSSGSRTEHGEPEANLREVPLSSAIFKVSAVTPTDLKNDEAALQPYLFADGTRNTFDLAFNADGDLFGAENGPDIDLPDEVNFLEQGKHYGFPWRFGDVDNPVLDPAYVPAGDKRLNTGYGSVKNGSYKYDAMFPAKPATPFTDPIKNLGPAANVGRADRNAEPAPVVAGLAGITGHRSPLGLAFDTTGALCGEYYKAGFLLSYGALIGSALGDAGEDLLLLTMKKENGVYTMNAKQLAKGIKTPMDSVLVGNKLFTVGFTSTAALYVFVLPTP
ncbi:MAG: cytochrome c class [Polyangiaceae bacterium]|nr:cytochrome c class [Polyangiaceae bacterium]